MVDEHIIHIGQRDEEETIKDDSHQIQDMAVKNFPWSSIQEKGVKQTSKQLEKWIDESNVQSYWLHFDTDVLADEENPAVDYRLAGGLSFDEYKRLLKCVLQTQKIAGMSIGIYNPELDKERDICRKLIRLFEEILMMNDKSSG